MMDRKHRRATPQPDHSIWGSWYRIQETGMSSEGIIEKRGHVKMSGPHRLKINSPVNRLVLTEKELKDQHNNQRIMDELYELKKEIPANLSFKELERRINFLFHNKKMISILIGKNHYEFGWIPYRTEDLIKNMKKKLELLKTEIKSKPNKIIAVQMSESNRENLKSALGILVKKIISGEIKDKKDLEIEKVTICNGLRVPYPKTEDVIKLLPASLQPKFRK